MIIKVNDRKPSEIHYDDNDGQAGQMLQQLLMGTGWKLRRFSVAPKITHIFVIIQAVEKHLIKDNNDLNFFRIKGNELTAFLNDSVGRKKNALIRAAWMNNGVNLGARA